MPPSSIHVCQCPSCESGPPHLDQERHRQMNLLISRLDEQQRRWYAALESTRLGHGGDEQIFRITGLDPQTIRRGRRELATDLSERPGPRIRAPGAGRPRAEKRPLIEAALLALVEPETAGDPMTEQKWVRSSLRSLSERLRQAGHSVSAPTVSRLLKAHDYSLRVNAKEKDPRSQHPDRDSQFRYIATQKQHFMASGDPIISVDTKKKEVLGDFKNAGQAWRQEAETVNVHDFLSDSLGRVSPYGVYDVQRNEGAVYVGVSADTPEFAVAAILRWWHDHGYPAYPHATRLLILADGGGSNGHRPRLWKDQLQSQLSDGVGLSLTLCHYPTGCSKWNPIEHRLFSQISLNWAGQPLRTCETMLGLIRGTTTQTGLQVSAHLLGGLFETGKKVSDAAMKRLKMTRHAVCPRWNYTIRPRLEQALVR